MDKKLYELKISKRKLENQSNKKNLHFEFGQTSDFLKKKKKKSVAKPRYRTLLTITVELYIFGW